ncbi:MAG: hypothetical protein Q7J45_01000 [bacterium]|nr:hypothetical protein [bacterium]
MNPNDVPKKLVDQATVGSNPALFMILFATGNENHGFAITPEGAKAFYENLGAHIKEYEATVRSIDTTGLAPQILSPIQKK